MIPKIFGFGMVVKGKRKVRPITGHEGPEGEQRYSFTLFLTSALDGLGWGGKGGGGRWSTPCLGCFTPGKDPVPMV
jgi:hypothetical protein